ncbi:hypothetical protein MVEN_00590300 [Mycena venus]|uniref:F-box domain-containing protein n=1 Tax=Mycena venus TaxID=2733690 RepID=A0A8H6YJS1_9AGAR|nr:hypothetical protein MVEN_00590300 [Mycena venus]
MNSEFPQELLDEILEHFATDFGSLKICSLVCRAWVFRPRSHLFSSVHLLPKNIVFVRNLLSSPNCTLLSHIQSLHVFRDYEHKNDRRFNEIAASLHRLTNLRVLKLTTRNISAADAEAYFHTDFFAAFPQVARLVLSLRLDSKHDKQQPTPLLLVISLFPALQELRIGRLDGSVITQASAVPPHGLRSLYLTEESIGPIFRWLHACNRLHNVHSVKLPCIYRQHVDLVRPALQRLGGVLHHLDIFVQWPSAADSSMVFDFLLHPNLKTLAIRDTSWDSSGHRQFLLWMTRLAAPTLERLTLSLDLSLYDSNFDWAALDAFLCSARFPGLQSVVIECNHRRYRYDNHQFLHEALPLLESSGVLRTVCKARVWSPFGPYA